MPALTEKQNPCLVAGSLIMALVYWDTVVGKEISEHTEPFKISNGTVFVKVNDTTWRNELQYFKNEIIEKLNNKIGKKVVNDIKFY